MTFEPDVLTGEGLAVDRGGRRVFERLGFVVKSGEALILRGANGAGKSTLLRALAGLLTLSAGTLTRGGADVRDDPDAHQARLHYAGHKTAIKPALTVLENIAGHAALYGAGTEAAAQAAAAFGLAPLLHLPARYLSSGQERRASLARLLAAPQPLWLLDEPTVGLDHAAVRGLGEVMTAHLNAGGMIVAATHIDLHLSAAHELVIGAEHRALDATAEDAT